MAIITLIVPLKIFYGDKEKVKRIISNLLTNASKYTEEGYIYFKVNSEIKDTKCILNVEVHDTGRGIAENQKEFLFTKFYRLDSDKDSNIGGTGLGLAITKSLVELLNGKISVDSTIGVGTTFKVVINQEIVNDDNIEEILYK